MQKPSGRYFFRKYSSSGEYFDGLERLWTVYTKDADCGRGDYADEIDVCTDIGGRSTEAIRVAKAAIKAHYNPELRASCAQYRHAGVTYF